MLGTGTRYRAVCARARARAPGRPAGCVRRENYHVTVITRMYVLHLLTVRVYGTYTHCLCDDWSIAQVYHYRYRR